MISASDTLWCLSSVSSDYCIYPEKDLNEYYGLNMPGSMP